MKKTVVNLKKKALDNYTRMIEWAEKQNPNGRVSHEKIAKELKGENWCGSDCVYCEKYYNVRSYSCGKCPLTYYPASTNYCCGGAWMAMNEAGIWAKWIEKAKLVREWIRRNG